MEKQAGVLIVSRTGKLLMRRGADGLVEAFTGVRESGDVPVRSAVRVLRHETGLDVHADDLEFLDMYAATELEDGENADLQLFVLAGVDEERVHVYGSEELLQAVKRSDDFEVVGLTALARRYVIDYFKAHKK